MTQPAPRRDTPGRGPAPQPAHPPTGRERHMDAQSHDPEHILALRESFWKWGRLGFGLVALYVAIRLLLMLGGIVAGVLMVLLYVVFGGIVALVVAPLNRLLRHVMPRALAALLSLLVLIACVLLLGFFLSTSVLGQVKDLTHALPKLEAPLQQLQQFAAQHGINLSLSGIESALGFSIKNGASATIAINVIGITISVLVDLVVVLVSAFWLLDDHESLRSGLMGVLPARWRVEVDFLLNAFVVVFGGYIRGQLVLALVVGALAGIGCALIGVPFPIIVGVAAGVFELIPLFGPFVGGAVAVLFALTVRPTLALETVGVFIIIHIIEGYVISPRLQGRFVRLHPLITLLALLVGVESAGFLGAFFAVPVASLLAAEVRAGVRELRTTQPDLFTLTPAAAQVRGRQRDLLAEYSLNLGAVLRRLGRRITGRSEQRPSP